LPAAKIAAAAITNPKYDRILSEKDNIISICPPLFYLGRARKTNDKYNGNIHPKKRCFNNFDNVFIQKQRSPRGILISIIILNLFDPA